MIGISTIRLIQSNKNFKTIITALYCLDQIISGDYMSEESWNGINKEHINILMHFIGFVSSLDDNDNQKYDNYIYQTVNCFIQNKRQININLYKINKDFVNSKIRDLMMHSLEEEDEDKKDFVLSSRDVFDPTNLFKRELLDIFKFTKKITLRLYHEYRKLKYRYRISLWSLLSMIRKSSLEQIILELGKQKIIIFIVDLSNII